MPSTLADLMAETTRYRAATERLCRLPLNQRIAAFIATGHATTRLTSVDTIFGAQPHVAVTTCNDPGIARTADRDRYDRAVSLANSLYGEGEAVALALAAPVQEMAA